MEKNISRSIDNPKIQSHDDVKDASESMVLITTKGIKYKYIKIDGIKYITRGWMSGA